MVSFINPRVTTFLGRTVAQNSNIVFSLYVHGADLWRRPVILSWKNASNSCMYTRRRPLAQTPSRGIPRASRAPLGASRGALWRPCFLLGPDLASAQTRRRPESYPKSPPEATCICWPGADPPAQTHATVSS